MFVDKTNLSKISHKTVIAFLRTIDKCKITTMLSFRNIIEIALSK